MNEASGGRVIGVDFGTTMSCVAVWAGGRVELVSWGSLGNRFPSAVYAATDGLLVGQDAQHSAGLDPSRYEATPKRSMLHKYLPLGDEPTRVVDAIAAVLSAMLAPLRVDSSTDVVVATHPAAWQRRQIEMLEAAFVAAGVHAVELCEEPVAAAWAVVPASMRTKGSLHAVFDWGGGTFDAAIVRWTGERFELAGQPAGVDPLGGEDIDDELWRFICRRLDPPTLDSLLNPTDMFHRRALNTLRSDLRHAKHSLSSTVTTDVAAGNSKLTITRRELAQLAEPYVARCVQTMAECLHNAGLEPAMIATVNLTGDASRMPIVAERLWAALRTTAPVLAPDPKGAVAQGAVLQHRRVQPETPPPPAPETPRPETPRPETPRPETPGGVADDEFHVQVIGRVAARAGLVMKIVELALAPRFDARNIKAEHRPVQKVTFTAGALTHIVYVAGADANTEVTVWIQQSRSTSAPTPQTRQRMDARADEIIEWLKVHAPQMRQRLRALDGMAYSSMERSELSALAAEFGIEGRSKWTKADFAAALQGLLDLT